MMKMMKMTAMRITRYMEQFMMWWLMAPNYGHYFNGGDDSGDANPNWKNYEPGDVNSDNVLVDDFDDDNDADANS